MFHFFFFQAEDGIRDVAVTGVQTCALPITLSGISWPFLRMALSNTMPRADSVSPLPRAEASVTCPTSFEPLGMTILPSDLIASVVRAFTGSPGLHFFESTGELSAALNAVPAASELFTCPFCADAEVDTDALPDACACVWPACTDAWLLLCAPACAPVCGWAAALMQKNAPTTNAIPARFMVVRPP